MTKRKCKFRIKYIDDTMSTGQRQQIAEFGIEPSHPLFLARGLIALYKWQDEPKKSICGVFVKGWVQCSQVDKYPSFVFVMFFIYNYKFVYLSVYLYCICKEYVEERLSRQLSLI